MVKFIEIFESKLPMDTQSRLERAKQMGFDIYHRWYHGTAIQNIRKFDLRKTGKASGSYHEIPAIFLTSDPNHAGDYSSVGDPIVDSMNWGKYREEYQQPMLKLFTDPAMPEILGSDVWVDNFYDDKLDMNAIKRHFEIPQDILAKVMRLKHSYDGEIAGRSISKGANIIPLFVRGNFSEVSMVDNFHEGMYDLFLRNAKQANLDGVLFKNVVDTPSGYGDPANVLAIMKRNQIRSIFAKFDPAKIESPNLMD